MLPAMTGMRKDDDPIRPHMLTQSFRSEFQLRKGHWKFLAHKGSGGNSYSAGGEWGMKEYAIADNDPDSPGQLYNLADDPGERNNLYSKYPEIVRELKGLLEASKKSGRSAPRREQ